jgi:pyridoxal phosphate enzyme (YggS family)
MERLNDEYAANIAANIVLVRQRMAAACVRSGRKPDSAELLVVTKFNPAEAVLAAHAAGARIFGENRVQEAEAKFAALEGRIPGSAVHLLGHLQSNKARKAATLFDCVQSVDSEDILEALSRRAADAGSVLDVLFELHTGEESKSGFQDAETMFRAMEKAAALPSLRPRGVMTMAPYTEDMAVVRASFKACEVAFSKAGTLFGFPHFNLLSMGMTNDFEVAIEEGSTMVRIGTAIFGSRVRQ